MNSKKVSSPSKSAAEALTAGIDEIGKAVSKCQEMLEQDKPDRLTVREINAHLMSTKLLLQETYQTLDGAFFKGADNEQQ